MASGGNSTSTTAPMIRVMRPVPGVAAGAVVVSSAMIRIFRVRVWQWSVGLWDRYSAARASAPETISEISWVMSPWRAWLASLV